MNELKKVYKNKAYILLLALTAACGYGFKIAHPVIGIDDTPGNYYFAEGLIAVVGRWVLFVLNKVVSLSEFAPFLTDFAAVLILMMAVTVWGGLFYTVFGEKIPRYGYWFFACLFLSCPLIAEVFTYYLHNGIAIGYLFCGISLWLFREGLEQLAAGRMEKTVGRLLLSSFAMVVAMGCYESFMVVWLTGVLLLFLSERLVGVRRKVFASLCIAALVAACSMVLRSLVLKLVIALFHLEDLQEEAVHRSVAEMLGWIAAPGAGAEFAMALKRLLVMYGVFGYAYLPIRIFVFSAVWILLFGLWRSFRQKDPWILLLTFGTFVAAFLLAVVEGKATLYRSAQFLPLLCAYGVLTGSYALACFGVSLRSGGSSGGVKRFRGLLVRGSRYLFVFICVVTLWNQCTDLNKWFYVDYRKYEYTKEYMLHVADELERKFDMTKPVIFTGNWENPKSLVEEAYVPYSSETFFRMKRVTDLVDEHLLEKFYREYGVWVAQTPSLTVISWGKYAFDTDEELIRFLRMHGHDFRPLLDKSLYEPIEQATAGLPSFPREGSIVDAGDYIVVHL